MDGFRQIAVFFSPIIIRKNFGNGNQSEDDLISLTLGSLLPSTNLFWH